MDYFTKKDLISILENVDDECRMCVRCVAPLSGDSLFFDLEVGVTTVGGGLEVVYIGSDDLNLTISGDVDLIKDGVDEL